ncbi:SDR family oxidoreductase [Sphingoaurantiacus capsulatus]|uniref:SDR family oxidoreductase n=1 Tax=Sphingoaurantiacus capsulatus TaxID=1771310 RepID=A0ABV7XDW5_9SPHN
MPRLLIIGQGYTGARLATRLWDAGWDVIGTSRTGSDTLLAFDHPAMLDAIKGATHILLSVPPEGERDPVLERYGEAIRVSAAEWVGYLSSTGVYGDAGGAWVDESAPVGTGRRSARAAADLAWQALRADMRVFRLPGIYGPGRSALDRLSSPRVDAPGHLFSRIHVDDIVGAVVASFERGPGVWNVADDEPATSRAVAECACDLAGVPYPPLVTPDELSAPARAFYSERRAVANGKMKRDLGYRLRYPNYREGLRACVETTP